MIQNISSIVEEKQLVKELLNRLVKWQTLFVKLSQPGLSPESQRGLYGELFFLKKLFKHTTDNLHCLNTWKGPSKTVQDFQVPHNGC